MLSRYKLKFLPKSVEETKSMSHDYGKVENVPDNLVILFTVPRTGSTWLTDNLRAHPNIEMAPSAAIFRYLKLAPGERRYPRDLSQTENSRYEIEMFTDGGYEKIPVFLTGKIDCTEASDFAIEKIHPESFDFDPQRFCASIEQLIEAGKNVKLIYQVRKPEDAFSSFLNYQLREPTWYNHLSPKDLTHYLKESYACILKAKSRLSGHSIDFDELHKDQLNSIMQIYNYIWPSSLLSDDERRKIAIEAIDITARDKRVNDANKQFLGTYVGQRSDESKMLIDRFINVENDWLASCAASYKSIIN